MHRSSYAFAGVAASHTGTPDHVIFRRVPAQRRRRKPTGAGGLGEIKMRKSVRMARLVRLKDAERDFEVE